MFEAKLSLIMRSKIKLTHLKFAKLVEGLHTIGTRRPALPGNGSRKKIRKGTWKIEHPPKRDSTPSPTSEGSQQCEGREPRPSTRRSGTPTEALKTSAFRRSTPERARAASTPRPRTTRLRPLPGACFESASFNCLHTLKKMRAVCFLAPASKRDPSRENTNRLTRVTRCVLKRSPSPPSVHRFSCRLPSQETMRW